MEENSSKKSTSMSRDELLTFLESYRNVIEFNSHVLEAVKGIAEVVREINDDISQSNHKVDIVTKDLFFKFETVLTLLKTIESNGSSIKETQDIIKDVKKLIEDIKDISTKDHNNLLNNVRMGWISMATFFAAALGSMFYIMATYYKEVEALDKLLKHFMIK